MLHHYKSEASFAAYVIGISVLLGSLIISGTLYHTFKNNPAVQGGNGTPQAIGVQDASGKVAIKLPSNTPFLGNANAKVTVVEYADYRCPFCEKFFSSIMPDLQSKYIATGKIKFVYQDVSFLGPDSTTAGEAAYCATEQNKFWQFHDYVFAHQGNESTNWASAPHMKQFAQALGLDTTAFNSCLDSGKYTKQVTADTSIANANYKVTGTPTTFVNGTPIIGAQPFSVFEQAIDAALK